MIRVFLALFVSGFCSVLFQEIWTKKAALIFGHTTHAITAVVSAFMLGLALGNALAPWMLRRLTKPMRLYVAAEMGVAAMGFLIAFLPWSDLPATVWTRTFVVLLLIVPTFWMGLTLPAAVSVLSTTSNRSTARAYFFNTAGAALAAITGAYALLPYFPSRTVSIAASILLTTVVPLCAPWLSTTVRIPQPGGSSPQGKLPWTWLVAAGVAGMVGLSQEIAWTRLLSLIFGPSVYAFGSVLFVYLVGIALGSWIANRFRARMTRSFLYWNFFITSFSILFGMLAFCLIPYAYVFLIERWSVGFSALRAAELLLGGLVIVPLAISQGLLLPCIVFCSTDDPHRESSMLGRIFAANTVGCILGAVLASLVLIPHIGIQVTLYSGAFAALAVFFLGSIRSENRNLRFFSAGLSVVLVIGIHSSWDRSVLASGVYKYAVGEVMSGNRNVRLDLGPLVYFKEGLSSTVAVISANDDLLLSVDGKVDASMKGDLSTQTLLGVLPMSFAKDPKNVLVIGLASGITSGSALLFDVPKVTTVEIEPAVARAQEYFSSINHAPLDDPRHRLILDDARSFLKNTREKFDVITSEPSNPWMSGVSSLFTREFFSLARSHMSESGIMCQWLPIYGMTEDLVFSIMKTFSSVFPHVTVFESVEGYDLLMLGSGSPISLDPEAVQSTWTPRVRSAMQKIRISSPQDLIGTFLLSTPFSFSTPPRLNTDDFGWVEYHAPMALHLRTSPTNHSALLEMSSGIESFLPSSLTPMQREAIKKKVFLRGDQVILR